MKKLAFIMALFTVIIPLSANGYEREIKNLSSNLADEISKAGKKTIAVVDFADLQGNITELGRFLAEEFSVSLTAAGKKLEVIDRTHLKSILREHQLALTGVIDTKTARKLGEIAGAHAIVTGTITPFGDSIRFTVKVLDVSTARIICASSADIPKTKAIEELVQKPVESPSGATITPPEEPKPSIQAKKLKHVDEKALTTLELGNCKLSGDNIIVSLAVTNNSKVSREYSLYPTTVVDEFGKSYKVATKGTRLGAESGPIPPRIYPDGGVGLDFAPDHSILLFLTFEKVSPLPRKIEAIIIKGFSQGVGGFETTFRGIPIIKGK